MMLPFEPEPLEALKARYPAALAEPVDVAAAMRSEAPHPGLIRRCVFDSPDGLRLLVSRDAFSDGSEMLHLSGSVAVGTALGGDLGSGNLDVDLLLQMIELRFRRVSGDREPFDRFSFRMGRGVPHWFRTLREAPAHAV